MRLPPERLLSGPIRIVPVGPLREWTVMRGRIRLIRRPSKLPRRMMFTSVGQPSADAAAQQWLALQQPFHDLKLPRQRMDMIAEGGLTKPDMAVAFEEPEAAETPEEPKVFWRLAVGPNAIALGADTFETIEDARTATASLPEHADDLIVSFVFSDHRRDALWLAADRSGVPVLIGMPDSNLAATFDPRLSVAAALTQATPLDYVHSSRGGHPAGLSVRPRGGVG